MKNLLWIGCGFIGQLFWKHYASLYHITATSTHPPAHPLYSSYPQQIRKYQSPAKEILKSLMQEKEIVVITVAPKTRVSYEMTYLSTVDDIASILPPQVKQIIYCSSTSIYGEQGGNKVEETTPLNPLSQQAETLIQSEKKLLEIKKNRSIDLCILRVGEIYHIDRNPYHRLKSQHPIVVSQDCQHSYTNMVHAEDLISAINYAITHQLSDIYNLCQPEHLFRKQLYDKIQNSYDLDKIYYDPDKKSFHGGNKYVVSHKIEEAGFKFSHRYTEVPFV